MEPEQTTSVPVRKETGAARRETTIHSFNRISNEIIALYHLFAARMGMADSDLMILYMLFDEGEGITQNEIMLGCGLSKQTVNSAVRKLQKASVLTLEEKTGRQRRIFLTEAGRELLQKKIRPLAELEESIFRSWTKEERDTFLRLNERFRDELKERLMICGALYPH